MPALGKFLPGLWRPDPVHLHVRAQEHGHMRGHLAEQRAGRRCQDHRHAAARDGAAAEGDHHEPEGDHPGVDLQVGALREPERAGGRAAGGQEEGDREQKHHGGCIEGPRGDLDAALADFAVAEAALREPGGRAPAASNAGWFGTLRDAAQTGSVGYDECLNLDRTDIQ